ncbi:MAG: amidohydrolase family protein [Gemmatimonadota bacterium]
MRINGHAHVFTLQSVLSKEAVGIMAGRLRRLGLRDFVVDAVAKVLSDQLDHPEYLVEDELLVRFVRSMIDADGFDDFLRGHDLPVEIRTLGSGGAAGRLEARLARAALDRLSSWIEANDGPGKSPFDVFETLRIAMQPSIPRVTDKLLAHLEEDDAIVALMMDITAPDEPERDRRNFLGQIRGTLDAVRARPGRVLPFIAVNPRRSDHYPLMKRAIEEQGFVGVKLYPSLGYEVTTSKMKRVVKYCRRNDVPIVIHATSGGFNKDAETAGYAHPKHWKDLFEAVEGGEGGGDPLRICFAHCGGWGGFCGREPDHVEWADRILGYMDEHPNVYADLSYHVDMAVEGGDVEAAYFDALADLLDGPHGDRIIFGTDSWLLRLNMDDAAYWAYFESKVDADDFDRIARVNPARFLGLPLAEGDEPTPNVRRHIEWVERHASGVGAEPAAWLRAASDARWTVVRSEPGWSRNNHAHVATYNHFRTQIPPRMRGDGFDDCAHIRLHQLFFFAGGDGPSDAKLRGNARNLMSLCHAYGGVPEAGYDDEAIHARLLEVLADGGRTLAETAASVDAMYLFSPEVV